MKTTISKTFNFDAAHFLPLLPEGHKCRKLHGHTYRVEIFLVDQTDELGMVRDYAEIAAAWEPLHKLLDHGCLNDIKDLKPQPTTEVLARFIFEYLVQPLGGQLATVRVYESETTWAAVHREDWL